MKLENDLKHLKKSLTNSEKTRNEFCTDKRSLSVPPVYPFDFILDISMATVSNEILEKRKRFLSTVSARGLHIDRATLFGSHAKGRADTWSDIDVVLVSKDFTGIGFYDRKRINPFLIKVDSRIELHPFKPEDFTEDNPFVKEILKQGIKI